MIIRAIQTKETIEHFRPRYAVAARIGSAYVKNLTGVSALKNVTKKRLLQIVKLVVAGGS